MLATAARLYARRLGWIAGLAGLASLPGLLRAGPELQRGLILLDSLVTAVGTATLLLVLHGHDSGAPLPPHRALARGLVAWVEAWFPLMEQTFTIFLTLPLVIPPLWLAARWALAWPVAVIEGRGLAAAARRSEGHRGLLLGLCWGSWLAALAVAGAIGAVLPGPAGTPLASLVMAYPTVVTYVCWRDLRAPDPA